MTSAAALVAAFSSAVGTTLAGFVGALATPPTPMIWVRTFGTWLNSDSPFAALGSDCDQRHTLYDSAGPASSWSAFARPCSMFFRLNFSL